MQFRFSLFTPLFPLCFLLAACQIEVPVSPPDPLDLALEELLIKHGESQGLAHFLLPQQLNQIPADPRNPLSLAKVSLGQLLFHETGLGTAPMHAEGVYTYSCASCHHVAAGFQAGRVQGIGDGGMGFGLQGEARHPNPQYDQNELDVQPIRSPSTLNTAFQELMLWNGQFGATGDNAGTDAQWTSGTPLETNHLGYEGLETQAIAGLKVHRLEVDEAFVQSMDYQRLFDAAFPGVPQSERYTREQAGLAIAAYERSLLATEAPFQRWLRGERTAMSENAKQGAILFFDKANCVSCHTGPALNQMAFYALAMPDLQGPGVYGDLPSAAKQKGRGGFTGRVEDEYTFKVPQLYNLKDSPFYGHGGTFRSIRTVVEYKNAAVPAFAQVPTERLAKEFVPLGLSEHEIDQLTAFLAEGLYDPFLSRYLPNSLPSGMCFPNNDSPSRQDLGCQ